MVYMLAQEVRGIPAAVPDRRWSRAGSTYRKPVRLATIPQRSAPPADDQLDAIRGILFGTLLSVVGFWLPLAVALTY